MGKTSLLVMLRMMHLRELFPGGLRVRLLKLGEDSLDRIEEMTGRAETVLLLDSLDEDPLAWRQGLEERLGALLRATRNFRQVIITCRTQFFPKGGPLPVERPGRVEIAGFICPMLYLSPFSDEQVNEYLHKVYPLTTAQKFWNWLGWTSPQLPEHEQAEAILAKVRTVQYRPMVLSHIEKLIEHGEKVEGEYDLYNAIVTNWLLREEQKHEDLTCEDLRQACHTIALRMHGSEPRRTITMREIWELLPEMANSLDELKVSGRGLLNRTSSGDFRFAHFSIQEFMVVQGVLGRLPYQPPEEGFAITEMMHAFIRTAPSQQCRPEPYAVMWLANLKEANLQAADLRGASLLQVNLEGADLEWGILTGADLRGASLLQANLEGADLEEADLEGADLEGATLTRAMLKKASLIGADLRGADLIGGTLNEADLRGAYLINTKLRGADLTGANLRGADLTGADLEGANLEGADLEGANLAKTSLKMAILTGADLTRAILTGADLRVTELQGADLEGADLREANLNTADLTGAILTGANLEGADLKEVDLGGADLGGADLTGADLEGAGLEGAKHTNKTRWPKGFTPPT